jgi:uncharacterized membrane protein HdeD (DUF308 family)
MLLLVSLLLIINPEGLLTFAIILLGCVTILDGIIHIVSYFSTSAEVRAFSFELIQGILGIILGCVIIFNPQTIVSFFPFMIGLWIVVEGFIRFQFTLNMKGSESKNWVVVLLFSIISIVLGFLIIFNPFGTAIAITKLAGIFLFISEVLTILESICIICKLK